MMFRTIWSKTLRDYRTPTLGWGIGMAIILLGSYAAFAQQGSQATASLNQIAQTFRFFGDPVSISTLSGFITWRVLDLFAPTALSIWALLAGARMVRGDEERNAIDLLLATPTSRTRLLLEKLSALLLALLILGLLISLGIILGEASTHQPVETGRAILAGLNASLCAFCFAALALFLSQFFINRGTAAGITGGLLTLSILLDGTGRTIQNGTWLQRFSLTYYYAYNKPLIESYTNHPWATLLLGGLALLLCALSLWLFSVRDMGGVAIVNHNSQQHTQRRTISRATFLERAYRAPATKSMSLHTLYAQVGAACWWLIGIVFYTAWGTSLTPSLLQPLRGLLQSNPVLDKILNGQSITTNAGILGYIIFQFVPLIVIIYSMIQALQWSTDLDTGRMELVLSTPHTRMSLFWEHFLVVLLQVIITPILVWLAIVLSAQATNIALDNGRIAAAAFGILPMELVIVSVVYACAGRLRSTVIVSLITLYLTCAFMLEWLGSLLNLPDWLYSLSIFHAYGNPIKDGWQWAPNIVMLGIALVLLVIGNVQFSTGDIDKGNA
jgi:ABC-2 type transport system permease protein